MGAPGGVYRPPFTEDDPCRATAVPIQMCFGLAGSTEIAAMERSFAAATLPGTSDQWTPPSVDLYRPMPASESLEPFGSPVPAYTVCPLASVGST